MCLFVSAEVEIPLATLYEGSILLCPKYMGLSWPIPSSSLPSSTLMFYLFAASLAAGWLCALDWIAL